MRLSKQCIFYILNKRCPCGRKRLLLITFVCLMLIVVVFRTARHIPWASGKYRRKVYVNQLQNVKFAEDPIFKLDHLLDELDREIQREATVLKDSENRISKLMYKQYIHQDIAPVSPAEYIFPLHSAEALLQFPRRSEVELCNDASFGLARGDLIAADVSHPIAEVKKMVSSSNVMLLMSISPEHDYFKRCLAASNYWSVVGTDYSQHVYQKMAVEAIFRQELTHKMIVKLLDFCPVPSSTSAISTPTSATAITEYGTPLNIQTILQSSFKARLGVAADLADLLMYLEKSKFGSIFLANVSHDSFIEVEKEMKLFDLSGIDTIEPYCTTQSDCLFSGEVMATCNESGVCVGFHARANMLNFHRLFFHGLLSGVKDLPPNVAVQANAVRERVRKLTLTSEELLSKLRGIVNMLSPAAQPTASTKAAKHNRPSGNKMAYKTIPDADLFDRFDYKCPHTRADWGCVRAVHTQHNAERLCTADPQCKAFVSIPHHSRKDWFIVFLKNGIDAPNTKSGSTLHIKLKEHHEVTKKPTEMSDEEPIPAAPEGGVDRILVDDLEIPSEEAKTDWLDEHLESFGSDTVDAIRTEECRVDLVEKYKSLFWSMEEELMALCGWRDMTDHQWLHTLLTSPLSSLNSVELQKSSVVVLDVDMVRDQNSVLVSLVASRDWSLLKSLIVFLVDRLLGFYLTPPTTGRVLDMTEITQAGIEDYLLELASSEGPQEPAVTKFNVTLFPKVSTGPDSNRRGISLRGQAEMVSEVVELEGEERKEMSYIMLSWLTGTSQDLNHLAVAKGQPVSIDNLRSFMSQQFSETVKYFHLCNFPKHIIEHLEVAIDRRECSLSNQISRALEVDHLFGMLGRSILDDHEVLSMLHFIDSAVREMMEVVEECIRRFGRTAVLFDASTDHITRHDQ